MWELIKGTVRNESIKYSSKVRKAQRENEQKIEQEIKHFEKELANNPNRQDIADNIINEKRKLDEIIDEKTKGLLLRSKAEMGGRG